MNPPGLKKLREVASGGDLDAQVELARALLPIDADEASHWFTVAAERGSAAAANALTELLPEPAPDPEGDALRALFALDAWAAANQAERAVATARLVARLGGGWVAAEPAVFDDLPVARVIHARSSTTFHVILGGRFAMGFGDEDARRLRAAFDALHYEPTNLGAMDVTLTKADGSSESLAYQANDEREVVASFLESLAHLRPVTEVTVPAFLLAAAPLRPAQLAAWLDPAHIDDDPGPDQAAHTVPGRVGEVVARLRAEGLRLPTEAEWEHAARAGRPTLFPHGDEIPRNPFPPPNRWGLADLGGEPDVCADHFHVDHQHRPTDARARRGGLPDRVVRGGAAMMWPWQDCGEWLMMLSAERTPDRNHEFFVSIRPARSI